MANADQVKALVASHADGDDERFYSIALQVAASAARGGQARFAQQLKDLIDRALSEGPHSGFQRLGSPIPVVQPHGELSELLAAAFPPLRLPDLVIADAVRRALERVILEHRQEERLNDHGFRPLRRILLVGPPGTGKTMSAGVLAGELHLPLFTIRLDGIITKFMGETASKLRLVFDALAATRGVYLFDEVDALGGRRAASNDVGEIRRVLNSFLQFLERDDSDSILIAATNHPQLLDRAIFRRFDAVVEYPLPQPRQITRLIQNRLIAMPLEDITWPVVEAAATGLSHAEVTLAAERTAKDALLSPDEAVTTGGLVRALRERLVIDMG